MSFLAARSAPVRRRAPVLSLRLGLQLGLLLGLLVALAAASARAGEASGDPGLVLDLDRAHFVLETRDARSGDAGPRIRIALGSPANDTPNGDHPVGRVILNPSWHPSADALAAGAKPLPPSLDGPMGVAKIPFARTGAIALHGGGDPRLLGKPVSGGCVRARDADLLRVIAWLLEQGALGDPLEQPDGEVHRSFRRPVLLRIH